MGGSFKLFSIGNIDLRMHVTFPLILIWAAIQFGVIADGGMTGAVFGVIVVSLLFVIVTLHELGHSFAAIRYGVPVDEIVLLPIGGVAQLREIPENPLQELVVAIAGPAVNFVLAVLFGIVLFATDVTLIDPAEILTDMDKITGEAIFSYIFIYNLFLGLFNLLPAFPMDGGRVLRAVLATFLPYVQATTIAATIGRGMAWLFGLWGFLGGGFFLIFVAFFVYIGAGQEEQIVKTRTVLRGLTVQQVYSRPVQTLNPQATLQEAVALTLSSTQSSFPICDGTRLVGLLTYPRLVQALSNHPPATPVSQVMAQEVRPVAPTDELFAVQQLFSENQLDALPVMENGNFLGLLTRQDIAEAYRLLSVEPSLLKKREVL